MESTLKKVAAIVVAVGIVLACGFGVATLVRSGGQPVVAESEQPEAQDEPEAPDGDCDTGDLYESKPDPDCGGRWLGTPRPVASPKAPVVRQTPGAPTKKRR